MLLPSSNTRGLQRTCPLRGARLKELSRRVRSRLRVRLQGLEDEDEEEERAEHTNTGSMHGSWELTTSLLQSSSGTIRLEALLGKGQVPTDRQESGPSAPRFES